MKKIKNVFFQQVHALVIAVGFILTIAGCSDITNGKRSDLLTEDSTVLKNGIARGTGVVELNHKISEV